MSRFFTKALPDLDPYVPGEQPRDRAYIKLNTNENPYPPSPMVLKAISREEVAKLNLYSDPECTELNEAIAREFEVEPCQVFTGNGSDEVLAFAIRAFCGPEMPLAFSDVTYGCYKVWCGLFDLPTKVIPLREDFTLNVEAYKGLKATLMITNPNAPTTLALPVCAIEALAAEDPERVVIVDEAYIDFGGQTSLPLLKKYPNVLVVRTFSKSRNLAGARLGFALGSPELIEDLNRIKFCFNPYNVNRLTCLAGKAAIEDKQYFEKCVAAVKATRERTTAALRQLGFDLADSNTNFLFAKSDRMDAAELAAALRQKGIIVRYFTGKRTGDRLRITVGTDAEMDALLQAVKDIYNTL